PMGGMNQEEKEDMARFVLDINAEWGTTIILIEHDMGVVMDISDRVAVLDYGRKIADGPPDEGQKNPDVIRAYLGGGRHGGNECRGRSPCHGYYGAMPRSGRVARRCGKNVAAFGRCSPGHVTGKRCVNSPSDLQRQVLPAAKNSL